MKRIWKAIFSALTITILTICAVQAQGNKTIEKSFTWNYELGKEGTLELNNYDCDLVIHAWDKAETMMKIDLIAEMRNQEDARELENFINKLEFDNSPARVKFKTRFWISRKNIVGRKTIKLTRGKTLSYRKFKIKAEVWLPATADFELSSKYSTIYMDMISGDIKLKLYNDKLTGKEVKGSLVIDAKYSDLVFNDCNMINASLYESDIKTGNTSDATYISKYSGITSRSVGKLEIDSYNDKFKFDHCGDISMVSKYSYLSTTDAKKVIIDSYEGGFELGECTNLEVKSKYTNFLTSDIIDLIVENSYSSKFNINTARSVTIRESKYSTFKLDALKESIVLDNGYEDKVILDILQSGFKTLRLNGKYIKCEAGIADDISFRFKANIKYPHLNLEKADLTTRIKIKESSDLEFEAYRGEESESLPLIQLSGYEMTFTIL